VDEADAESDVEMDEAESHTHRKPVSATNDVENRPQSAKMSGKVFERRLSVEAKLWAPAVGTKNTTAVVRKPLKMVN